MKLKLMPDFLGTQDSTCLSIYLPRLNGIDLSSNKHYLKYVKTEVQELLRWSHETDVFEYFLSVIDRIQENPELVKNQKNHVSIFITKDGQWDFRFSGHCKPFFSLANSFHVKPMLRYFHRNRKFFVLRFNNDRATLYVDGPEQLKALDSIVYPSTLKENLEEFDFTIGPTRRAFLEQFEDFSNWISDWISRDLLNEDAPLLVVGIDHLVNPFTKNSTYKNTVRKNLRVGLSHDETDLFKETRKVIEEIAVKEEKKAIKSFRRKQITGLGSTNLARIAKEAIKGNISVLMVAKDDQIWGELNRMTGDIRVHHEQLTDLDDDLLDDLAEVVLANRDRVLVLDKNNMPTSKPIAAIFKDFAHPLQQQKILTETKRTLEHERKVAI